MKISANIPCLCGSEKKYKKCCRIYHEGANPSTAEELMRSRYTAFATKKIEYIINTTHKNNTDYTENIETWSFDVLNFCNFTKFEKLEVLEVINGDKESFVTFKATLKQANEDSSFTEKSRFLKEDGKWFYVDGTIIS